MSSREQVRREIAVLEAQLDSQRQLMRVERARALQKVELVRRNWPMVLGGALAGGLAIGALSRKSNRRLLGFALSACQACYRH